MSKVLAIFGATGTQGGAVLNFVLNDPELASTYTIRAITRDVGSLSARELREKKKVEVVRGDVYDRASLETAMTGVHTVFAMTTPVFGPNSLEAEYNNAKTIADVAVETKVQYLIFSSLPSPRKMSGGKYTGVTVFDAKAQAEQYIRGLPIRSAFFAGAYFFENIQQSFFFSSEPTLSGASNDDGKTWVIGRHISPQTSLPWIDATRDTGKFVGAILADPDKYEGKTFCAGAAFYTWERFAAIISKATGKKVVYRQIPVEDFRKTVPPVLGDIFADGFSSQEEFGYFGPDSEQLVAWAAANARGKLTTLEEYLEANPLKLE
ncbi:hypothetical protein ASPZODRAFT_132513 [Penicilliopsis zonata CBS 506.65]|uniref:NmrA-like domain-containing protein n=1 Tax=Penicilliopsis zonata CBS 506.65 TaxID=1073090 RepID=A0A1L9SGP8_9EURO|nr:hypothetical protein ASPZODRAFT_132513 [Penicilliopsis zonata CBS 506.65]OJJ46410.1 hypothetical protein ASPZODRAFT_132513 [Penicilliopsis zonata CBS 506.65]